MLEEDPYAIHPAPRSRGPWRWVLLGLGLAFVLGIGLAIMVLGGGNVRPSELFGVRRDAAPVAQAPITTAVAPLPNVAAPPVPVPVPAATAPLVQPLPQQAGGIDSRLAALEQRLNRLDMQNHQSASFAVRSENLLVAFATRRALERGQPLGYLADQLRLRFSESHPNAVQTVIAAAENPVALDQLLVDLDLLDTELESVPDDVGLLDRLGIEAGRLFSVRSEGMPSPMAERRIERARAALANGQVERAIAEVRLMPGAANARGWLAQAQAYADAQRALEVLEAASVAEPRALGVVGATP